MESVVRTRSSSDSPLPREGDSLSEMLESYERRLIEKTLREAEDNVAEAARRLNTDRPNLYRRMKRLGIRRQGSDE